MISRLLASILLAAHLVAVGISASPALHHWLHGDADEPAHQCAATTMIDGQIDSSVVQGPEIRRTLVVIEIRNVATPAEVGRGYLPASPGERAPPLA